jgi:hypothetical protein
MKLIYLNTGETVKVDDADYDWLSKHKWYAKASAYNVYACRSSYNNGRRETICMAREIMQCPKGKEVDHINGDTLDNRRENLEIVTKSENIFREQLPLFRPNNHNNHS